MKKFTDNVNEKQNHYSGDKKLYNEIYNLIEETIYPKMNSEISDKLSIIGKENLVNELSKIVENEITKTKIQILEAFKNKPNIIVEKVGKVDELISLIKETIKK